jgi:hypothetical protein
MRVEVAATVRAGGGGERAWWRSWQPCGVERKVRIGMEGETRSGISFFFFHCARFHLVRPIWADGCVPHLWRIFAFVESLNSILYQNRTRGWPPGMEPWHPVPANSATEHTLTVYRFPSCLYWSRSYMDCERLEIDRQWNFILHSSYSCS